MHTQAERETRHDQRFQSLPRFNQIELRGGRNTKPRKFAEMLYTDPFESTQISAERPLDRARLPEPRKSPAKVVSPPSNHFYIVFRWKGAFIVAQGFRAKSKEFIRYSTRERTCLPSRID